MTDIAKSVLNRLGEPELLSKLCTLPASDLNSLLLELSRMQATKYTPADVLKCYEANRFSAPSRLNPALYHLLELELLQKAEEDGLTGVLLSPLAPLGASSVFGYVAQNNIVSAQRGCEVVSDPTNMLALELAKRLKQKEMDTAADTHLCTTARAVRAQNFKGKNSFAHFGLFCIVSRGKDTGAYAAEKALLTKHLAFYNTLLYANYGAELQVVLGKRSGYTDGAGFFERMAAVVNTQLPGVPTTIATGGEGNNYYKGINFKIYMKKGDQTFEIGDGGFVNWLQGLTGSKKERCLISAISLDRLLLI